MLGAVVRTVLMKGSNQLVVSISATYIPHVITIATELPSATSGEVDLVLTTCVL